MTNYKYNEEDNLELVREYIASTYGQHYVGKQDIQTVDVWDSLDIAAEMCQGTAIKYLMRLGRKDGINEKDMLKAIHYIILLMHFTKQEKSK